MEHTEDRKCSFIGDELQKIPGVRLLHPVEASGVFAEMPDRYHQGLQDRGWQYYKFIGGGARLMCSWKTNEADIAALIGDLRATAGLDPGAGPSAFIRPPAKRGQRKSES